MRVLHTFKTAAVLAAFLVAGILCGATSTTGNRIAASTGSANIVREAPDRFAQMGWEQYRETILRFSSIKAFVPLASSLEEGADEVTYGFNAVLPVGGGDEDHVLNLSWALIVRDGKPLALVIDLNASGLLADDPRLPFVELAGGVFEIQYSLRLPHNPVDSGEEILPLRWEARVTGAGIQLSRFPWRERTGEFRVAENTYRFALRTERASFAVPEALLGIDLNRDGVVEFEGQGLEAFRIADQYVGLQGREYRIAVATSGDTLALEPTGRAASPRPTLLVGSIAPWPDAGPTDTPFGSGVRLLAFWSPRCSFSTRMAPELLSAQREFPDVRFLSITSSEESAALEFAGRFSHGWPQISGSQGRQLFDLYRVREVPTYVLIDSLDVIRATGSTLDWPRIRTSLAELGGRGRDSSHPGSGERQPSKEGR